VTRVTLGDVVDTDEKKSFGGVREDKKKESAICGGESEEGEPRGEGEYTLRDCQ